MAKGVRYLKTKTVVNLAALEMFLGDFTPNPMIKALINLCELAATHPDFDEQHAGWYDWADQATDILMVFFLDRACCEDGSEGAPAVELNCQRGAIEILKPRIRHRRRPPSPERATAPVPLRLAKRHGASN